MADGDGIDDDPPLPDALAEAFRSHPEAHERWRRLPRGERWFQIGPIRQAKRPDTQQRRSQAIVDWLLHEVDDTSVPSELEAVLTADAEVRRLFDALPARDRTYWSQYVREAKKPETRVRRAEKVAARLPAKAAEKEDRKARGTDDLGGRFGQIVIDSVGADLRAAGYRPRAKGKHWRRATVDRADLIGFHTFMRVSPEFAELRLEHGIYLPALGAAGGELPADPTRVPTEAGIPVVPGEGEHFSITGDVDEAALGARIRAAVLAVVEAIDALGDVTDPDVLLRTCETVWPRQRTAALVLAGRPDDARRHLLDQAHQAAAGGEDVRHERRWQIRAERFGIPVEDLPEADPAARPPDAGPAAERILQALGDTATWCFARRDGSIDLKLVQPTDEQLAQARILAGDLMIRIDVLDTSLADLTAIVRRLHHALRGREEERDDLVARVASYDFGGVMVEVANLDPVTEALIREIVPEGKLTIIDDRPADVLLVQKRERSGPGADVVALDEILAISRALGADGSGRPRR